MSQNLNTFAGWCHFSLGRLLSLFQTEKDHMSLFCHQVFAGFDPLRLHRQKVHNAQTVSEIGNVDVGQLVDDDGSLKEELKNFRLFLVGSEMANGRHRVFRFAMEVLDTQSLSKKLDTNFKKLKFAAKLNVAYGILHENVEDGTRLCYYADENYNFLCTPVTFAVYLISKLSLKFIVVQRVTSFLLNLETWRSIKQPARNELRLFLLLMFISSVKRCLTNSSRLETLI